MARTVTDLVQLLDVIAGVDPADGATAEAGSKIPPTYTAFLKRDGGLGRRIGVLRQASRPDASDPQVLSLFDRAIADLRTAGRRSLILFVMPEFDEFAPRLHPLSEVRAAIERYLARTGPNFPKSLAAVMALGKIPPFA